MRGTRLVDLKRVPTSSLLEVHFIFKYLIMISYISKSQGSKHLVSFTSKIDGSGFFNINFPNVYSLPYEVKGTNNKKCNLAPNTFFNHTRYNVKNL